MKTKLLNIVYSCLVILLMTSFVVQSLGVAKEIAELVEVVELDLELDVDEEIELDDEMIYGGLFELSLATELSFGISSAVQSGKNWSAPTLEVPELPPLLDV